MFQLSMRRTIAFCAVVFLLTGCAGSQSVNPLAQTSNGRRVPLAHHLGSSYKVLFDFNGKDGAAPLGDLLAVKDTLYGTTSGGGANGKGTVFSITTAGVEKVLYSFKGGSDGSTPTAGVIQIGETLYGTTYSGGKDGDGIVFSLSTTGTESVLYSFKGGSDGAHPRAPLANDAGTLYGTTEYGGGSSCGQGLGCGTVFSVTPGGSEAVVYGFQGGKDGRDPRSGLTLLKGKLYGTTRYGGTFDRGTLYGMTTSGSENVLWNFEKNVNGGPGAPQYGSPTDLNGQLVGAASAGANHGCGGLGCGALYDVNPKAPGQLSIITIFTGGNDGGRPLGTLLYASTSNGTIMGTTFEGGTYGNGTVYSLQDGAANTLHSFAGGKDGGEPYGGLTMVNGTAYGTTNGAGSRGTVFAVKP